MNSFNVIDSCEYLDLPFGCKAFGLGVSSLMLDQWISTWKSSLNDINAFLVIAGTKTDEVQGISAAGATVAARKYTAIADAELFLEGPSSPKQWPLPPLQAGVSPALISNVCARLLKLQPLVLAIGLRQSPPSDFEILEDPSFGPANCLSTGNAMTTARVERLWQKGFEIGLKLHKPLFLSECVPGGTTTALAVLTGLEINSAHCVSSSVKNPPIALKRKLVKKGLRLGEVGPHTSPQDLLAAVGDPFQAFSTGLLLGARKSRIPVLLGGGSQMIAVLALALSSIDSSLRTAFIKDISIATTSWLVREKISKDHTQSSFFNLIALLGNFFDVNILGLSSGLTFQNSSKQVLKDYELGYIKEGVGLGALLLLAQLHGVSCKELLQECEIAVDQLHQHL